MRGLPAALDRGHCQMAHIRYSRPNSGIGLHVKTLKTFTVVPYLLEIRTQRALQGTESSGVLSQCVLREVRCIRRTVILTGQARPRRVLNMIAVCTEWTESRPRDGGAHRHEFGSNRVDVKRLETFEGLQPERQGQNLALSVSCLPDL